MLAKVITLRNERDGKVSAGKLMDYLSRNLDGQGKALADYVARDGVSGGEVIEGGSFNLEGMSVATAEDRSLVVKMMDYVSEDGRRKTRFKSNPLYHYALSWRDCSRALGGGAGSGIGKPASQT